MCFSLNFVAKIFENGAMKVLLLVCLIVIGLTKADPAQLGRSAQCDGTVCPSGCCPEPGWFCCPNTQYCASKPENCPPGEFNKLMLNIAKEEHDETS